MVDLYQLAQLYIDSHEYEISVGYVANFRWTLKSVERFIGTTPTTDHLTTQLMNAWMAWMSDRGLAGETRRSRRGDVMALWKFAYEEGLLDVPPRIKRPKIQRRIPRDWTLEEIKQLVAGALRLTGTFQTTGIRRDYYLSSLLVTLYSTALRLGDALAMRRSAIADDGSVAVQCNKTGRSIVRVVPPDAIWWLDETGARDRELCWPLWGRREALYRLIRVVVRQELPEHRWGTVRFLRRSAATQTAIECGVEAAQELLDHRHATTTWTHYLSDRIRVRVAPVAHIDCSDLRGTDHGPDRANRETCESSARPVVPDNGSTAVDPGRLIE